MTVRHGPTRPRSTLWLALLWSGAASLPGCVAQLDDLGNEAFDGAPSGVATVMVTEPQETSPASVLPTGLPVTGAPSSEPTAPSPGSWSLPPSCKNGVWDSGETDIDCGGLTCPACATAWSCEVDEDCQSRQCAGVCLALECGNGIVDLSETDKDCGGACQPCSAGAGCYEGDDCESGICLSGKCEAPSCDDGKRNGNESDVDCGGGGPCDTCETGKSCQQGADCLTGNCVSGACVQAACTDGARNAEETDVDCGGPDCPPCDADRLCLENVDCASELCVEFGLGVRRCSVARCDDGVLNGRESDVDCGGPDCSACGDGAVCHDRSDCESSVCDRQARTCAPPTCSDATKNGDETGVDCGGSCQPCADGGSCLDDRDCLSGVCGEGLCLAASCVDGERNQAEVDVDCGGECPSCALGATCTSNDDCRSGACDGVCLPGVAGKPCGANAECLSASCTDGQCDGAPAGATCNTDAQCTTQSCLSGSCAKGGWNASCTVDADCATNRCEARHCAPSGFVIETEGGTDTSIVDFKARISASDGDPARQWRDLAFLYFFTAEAHDDFVSRYYAGPDFDVWDARFLARSFDGRDWAMIWRASPNNTAIAPSTVTTIVYQVRNDPWATFILTNDYSYRSVLGVNGRVVVCQRVGGKWLHTQGIPPTAFPDPCALVVDSCAGAPGICDPLMRTQ